MGGQRRYSARPPLAYAATVGAMKDQNCKVYAVCTRCRWSHDPLPLDPIIAEFGPKFSLFDRRPKCRQPNCTGLVAFMYAPPGGTTPFRICSTATSSGGGYGYDGWFLECTDADLSGIVGHQWHTAGGRLWAWHARKELERRLESRGLR